MSVKRLLVMGVGSVMVFIGVSTGVAHADNHTSRTVQGTTNGSVYDFASNVTVNGTVNGDVFCGGDTITINATVNGDVICTGQDVTVSGTVNGNVRLAGQVVNLNAKVTRSASIAAQDITVNSGSGIGRDLSLAGQTATISAPTVRDINGTVGSFTLSAPVGRNITLHANSVTLESGAIVLGDLTYTSPHTLQKNSGAFVHGTTTYHMSSAHHTISLSAGWLILPKLYWLVAMAVLSVVVVALFPRLFHDWNISWGAPFWWAVLIGFTAMFVVPLVGIIIAFTVIGIPLVILLALLWIAAAILTVPFSAYFIGSLVVPKLHPVLLVLVGVVILGVIELIPVLGWVVGFFAYWLGSGMLLMGLKHHYRRPVYERESS